MLGDMKTLKIVICFAVLLLLGCSSLKNSMIKTGENIKEVAIYNAILDFSKKCSLFQKDSVFSVSFKDSLYSLVLKQIDERNFRWVRDRFYEGVVTVSILAFPEYQFYYSEETKGKLPSRYVIKAGKLFYWSDHNYTVTEEMLAVLWKYNLLQEDFLIPEFSTNDSQKGADYYFCKNDLSKYKRVITNKAIGYYDPPKLKCND